MRRMPGPPVDLHGRVALTAIGILSAILLWGLGARAGRAWLDAVPDRAAAVEIPFSLVDQDGSAVSSSSLKGRPVLLSFGQLHGEASRKVSALVEDVVSALGPSATGRLNVVFITTDPEGDTPQAIRDHVASMRIPVIALTGAPDRIAAVARAYGLSPADRRPAAEDAARAEWPPAIHVLDAGGRVVACFPAQAEPVTVARAIARLM
jgi:protein SCO1